MVSLDLSSTGQMLSDMVESSVNTSVIVRENQSVPGCSSCEFRSLRAISSTRAFEV